MSYNEQQALHLTFTKPCLTQSHINLMQVLSNADLRAKYDAHGVEGLDVNFMDTAEFFSMLFGSESFDHLLGELSLARMTRYGRRGHFDAPLASCLFIKCIPCEHSICHAVGCCMVKHLCFSCMELLNMSGLECCMSQSTHHGQRQVFH